MFYLVSKDKLKDPRILAMVKANGDEVDNLVCNQVRIDSWYSVSKREPGNPWKHMTELYGKHEGKTILVTGSGPTVKQLKTRILPKDWVVMSANRSVMVPDRVDYWCASDPTALEQVNPSPKVNRVLSIQLYSWMKGKPFYAVEMNGQPLRWRKPETRPLYWNETTLGWMLHLAIRMGAARIITIGTELSYDGQYDGYVQRQCSRDWQIAQHGGVRDRMLEMFKPEEKLQWYERPVEMLDASNGALPIPKVRLEDVL